MRQKILIIEDEFLMLSFLQQRLQKEDLAVSIASDGDQAMGLINTNKYDCILIDLMLPFISGFELISYIRANTINQATPIIVLSALGNEKTIVEAISIGANDFLKKPFALNVLVIKLKLLLKGHFISHTA